MASVNLETQTLNYFIACNWLRDPDKPRHNKDHAVAILHAIEARRDLGHLPLRARQALVRHYKQTGQEQKARAISGNLITFGLPSGPVSGIMQKIYSFRRPDTDPAKDNPTGDGAA